MSKSVIVIGGGVAGLSAAIYARLAGHQVLVLEKGQALGGKASGIDQSGFRLDPGPSIIILVRIYEQLFADAGRRMADYLTFDRLDILSRVFFGGDEPIDLPGDRSACENLVDSIDHEDGKRFRTLMSRLDRVTEAIDRSIFSRPFDKGYQLLNRDLVSFARHFDVRLSYKDLIDREFRSPLLRAFFYGFPSYGGQSYHSKAPGALLIPYLMIQEGVFYPKGGVAAIPRALEHLARELGVEFELGQRIVALQTAERHVTSIILEDGSTRSADAYVSGVDRTTVQKWLGKNPSVRASYSYLTFHWGLETKFPSLQHHTLLVPRDFTTGFESLYNKRSFPTPPIVYLNETTRQDPTTAPPGCANLFAVVTSPSVEEHFDWEQQVAAFEGQVLEVMRAAGIQFSAGDIRLKRVQSPLYFEAVHENYKGSLYGVDEAHRLFGMLPQRNYDETYRNLYYCGGSVQPGAGLPMVLLSGKFAARKIDSG